MKLFLFLDDWFLDSRVDVVRRYCPARLVQSIEPPRNAVRYPYWNGARKCFEVAVKRGGRIGHLASADGDKWQAAPERDLTVIGKPSPGCKVNPDVIRASQGFDGCSTVLADTHERRPERRFKALLFPYTRQIDNCGGIEGGPGVVACSPDGISWTMNTEHRWYTVPKGSDTVNCMFYNPLRQVWQAICRKFNNDRRVAMVESPNLKDWTSPQIIVHPDVMDPPLMQFYGMPTALYEDEYFLGAVQCYHVPSEEQCDEHSQGPHNSWSKWTGSVDVQLVYSYDGQNWCRSDRTPLLARTEPGADGSGCVYSTMVSPHKDGVTIYGMGTKINHGVAGTERLLVYQLRADGFAYLTPIGGWGRFNTRCVVPRGKDATLNYQAPDGQVLVQAVDVERKPLPGYTFADCIPLTGDATNGRIQWRKHRDLSGLIGKRIRLEFRLADARIYALRVDCGLAYGNTYEPMERL